MLPITPTYEKLLHTFKHVKPLELYVAEFYWFKDFGRISAFEDIIPPESQKKPRQNHKHNSKMQICTYLEPCMQHANTINEARRLTKIKNRNFRPLKWSGPDSTAL